MFSLELSPITPNHLIVCTLDVCHRRARTGRGAGRRFAGVFVTALTSIGVSVLLTSELEDRCTDLRFNPYGTAFLTDAIIVQRYIEVQSRLLRIMAVVKVQVSAHSDELRLYSIDDNGLQSFSVGRVMLARRSPRTGAPYAVVVPALQTLDAGGARP